MGTQTGDQLPDLQYIKKRIPILAVARELGINPGLGGATWTMARCFRPEQHKSSDSTPSLGFQTKANRYMCFACDDRQHSNIDLVMQAKGFDLKDAKDLRKTLKWFDEHFPGIPRIKAETRTRNTFDFRAGVDQFRTPDDLIKAGIVPHLSNSSLRVFVVLGAFRESDTPNPSFETIKLRTGIGSNHTIKKAVRHLEELSILKVSRRWAKGRAGRDKNQYEFTFDDPHLFEILTERAMTSNPTTPAAREERTYLGNTSAPMTALKPPVLSTPRSALIPPFLEGSSCLNNASALLQLSQRYREGSAREASENLKGTHNAN